jgi:hypothetical protein
MPHHATGAFEISMTPASPPEHEGRTATARMLLDKRYFGDLVGTGKGEMLSAVTDTQGSAAYVAIERVGGILHGRKGSFVVHHNGTRSGGADRLSIDIVPDSGTEELTGISGKLAIKIIDGEHFYEVDYLLP